MTYRSTTGTSAINIHSVREVDGKTWIQSRDNLRTVRSGTEVGLETIEYTNPLLACTLVLAFAAFLGWLHGVLITKANLQPFVVTLCGLLIYRGLARVWTGDDQVGLLSALSDFKSTVTGAAFQFPLPGIGKISGETESFGELVWIDFPVTGVLLAIVAVIAWLFFESDGLGTTLARDRRKRTSCSVQWSLDGATDHAVLHCLRISIWTCRDSIHFGMEFDPAG